MLTALEVIATILGGFGLFGIGAGLAWLDHRRDTR